MVYLALQLMLKHTLLAGVPFAVACVLVTWSTDPSDVRDVGGSSVIMLQLTIGHHNRYSAVRELDYIGLINRNT